MIDERKLDAYLMGLMDDPLFGKPIAMALLRKNGQLRREVINLLCMAEKGKFKKEVKE